MNKDRLLKFSNWVKRAKNKELKNKEIKNEIGNKWSKINLTFQCVT